MQKCPGRENFWLDNSRKPDPARSSFEQRSACALVVHACRQQRSNQAAPIFHPDPLHRSETVLQFV